MFLCVYFKIKHPHPLRYQFSRTETRLIRLKRRDFKAHSKLPHIEVILSSLPEVIQHIRYKSDIEPLIVLPIGGKLLGNDLLSLGRITLSSFPLHLCKLQNRYPLKRSQAVFIPDTHYPLEVFGDTVSICIQEGLSLTVKRLFQHSQNYDCVIWNAWSGRLPMFVTCKALVDGIETRSLKKLVVVCDTSQTFYSISHCLSQNGIPFVYRSIEETKT